MTDSCFDTVSEVVYAFNSFVIGATGTTGEAFFNAMEGDKKVSDTFFKPYKDPANFGRRVATVVSAPFASAILAAEALAFTIYFAFESLVHLCMLDTGKAADSIGASCSALIGIFTAVIAALISPLVNLVDLIGGGVTTIMEQCTGDRMVDYTG